MDVNAPLPKYYQIQEKLREQISTLTEGDLIPPEPVLCEFFGASRITVRKAVDGLVAEGLLKRVQGKGTFVTHPKFTQKPRERFVNQITGFYGDMTSRGYTVGTRVLEQEIIQPSKQVAEKLELNAGDKVIKIVRLRFVDGQANHIVTTYLPLMLFQGVEESDLSEGSLYTLLREKYHVKFKRARLITEASSCTEEEAKLLDYEFSAPILVIYSQVFDPAGKPIVYGFSRLRADQSQIEFEVIAEEPR